MEHFRFPEVDVASLDWRVAKKSASINCVEVARLDDGSVLFRNSREPSGTLIRFTQAEFDAFVDGAKRGEFDDLVWQDGCEP